MTLIRRVSWPVTTAVALLGGAFVLGALGVATQHWFQVAGAGLIALVGVGVALLAVAERIQETRL